MVEYTSASFVAGFLLTSALVAIFRERKKEGATGNLVPVQERPTVVMVLFPIPVLLSREPVSSVRVYRLREGLRHAVFSGRVHRRAVVPEKRRQNM